MEKLLVGALNNVITFHIAQFIAIREREASEILNGEVGSSPRKQLSDGRRERDGYSV